MKLKIFNGRPRFKQWDLNQKLICEGVEPGTQIHFASSDSEKALVVESYELNGKTIANVPNILLQVAIQLYVYVYIRESDEKYTIHRVIFGVDERPKPDDYVYTETEILNYSALERRITSLEENLEEEVKEAIQKVIDEGDFDIQGGVDTEDLENAKTECKEYTDTKVEEYVTRSFVSFEEQADEKYASQYALEVVESIAKGRNQAVSFGSYADMIYAFTRLGSNEFKIGQNIYIKDTGVPDLWVSGVMDTKQAYEFTDNELFIEEIKTSESGHIQVGYYCLSFLETQEVDLTEYVKKEYVDDSIQQAILDSWEVEV